MKSLHAWRRGSAVLDDESLVSHAGLVPLMELVEQAGLGRGPAPKLLLIIG